MAIHGSPKDRGRADAWYGRVISPHKYDHSLPKRKKKITKLTDQEIHEYRKGYYEEDGRFQL